MVGSKLRTKTKRGKIEKKNFFVTFSVFRSKLQLKILYGLRYAHWNSPARQITAMRGEPSCNRGRAARIFCWDKANSVPGTGWEVHFKILQNINIKCVVQLWW